MRSSVGPLHTTSRGSPVLRGLDTTSSCDGSGLPGLRHDDAGKTMLSTIMNHPPGIVYGASNVAAHVTKHSEIVFGCS